MAQFDDINDLAKSGLRRLRDAEELLQPPTLLPNEAGAGVRHLRGAMYLAGYGVECHLKVYLITREPGGNSDRRLSVVRDSINARRQRSGLEPIRDICSTAGHSLVYLLELTDLEAKFDREQRLRFEKCAKWRSVWRYDPQSAASDEANEFVAAARAFSTWILAQV